MPLFDFLCTDCGKQTEMIVTSSDTPKCECGSTHLKKMLSAHSSLSGNHGSKFPGLGDTACCGSTPSQSGCAGPGSCCGKAH